MKQSWKWKTMSLLTCGAMLMGLMTTTTTTIKAAAEAPEQKEYTESSKTYVDVYLKGNDATIVADPDNAQGAIVKAGGKEFKVTHDKNKPSRIIAGGETNGSYGTVNITMSGGKVSYIFGGNRTSGTVDTANITLNGGFAGVVVGSSMSSSGVSTLNECTKNTVNTTNIIMNGGESQALVPGAYGLTYVKNANVTLNAGTVAATTSPVQSGILGGTNGKIDNLTINVNGGTTKDIALAQRSMITNKAIVNVTGGKVGNIYAGSYYDDGDNAAGTNKWTGWGIGDVNYGQAKAIEINVGAKAVYDHIYAGFQYLDKAAFINKYQAYNYGNTANIAGSESNKAVLKLAKEPTNDTSKGNQQHTVSIIDNDTYATTNWVASEVTLNETAKTLEIGQSFSLKATVNPKKANAATFTSSNTSIATVDKNGNVKAVKAGKATITAKSGDVSASCTVTVPEIKVNAPIVDPTKPVTSVEAGVDQSAMATVQKETTTLINEIVNGKEPAGVSKETADKIKQAVADGKTITPSVVTTPVDQVPAQDSQKIEAILGENAKVAQYLNLEVVLKAGDEVLGSMQNLGEKLTFVVVIPENMKAENRSYYVVRLHDGKAEKLNTIVNKDGTLSFTTDKFSTYALVYEDVKKPVNTDTTKPNTTTKPDTTKKPGSGVKTGDTTNSSLYYAMMIGGLALMGIVVVTSKKRKLVNK